MQVPGTYAPGHLTVWVLVQATGARSSSNLDRWPAPWLHLPVPNLALSSIAGHVRVIVAAVDTSTHLSIGCDLASTQKADRAIAPVISIQTPD